MIRADMIPDEVVEAAASDIVQTLQSIAAENGVTMTGAEEVMDGFREVARASIAAALNAWPGAYQTTGYNTYFENLFDHVVIPLPQEVSDDA